MKLLKAEKPSREVLAKIQSLKDKKGMIAVIEPKTGDYFLGRSLTEALRKAKMKYPHKVFHSIRIGYTFVHEHRGAKKGMRMFIRGEIEDFVPLYHHFR